MTSPFLAAMLKKKSEMPGWTDERVGILKKLWASGLSCSQIAAELGGVSRNAIIGKVHRLGLEGRARTPAEAGGQKKRIRKPRAAPKHPWLQMPAGPPEFTSDVPAQPKGASMDIPIEQRCSILELAAGKCRWPVGDPQKPDFFFCGGRAIEGIPYCGYHGRMAYQPVQPRRGRPYIPGVAA